VDVEDSVRARHDLDGADRALPFLEDPRRQTGGVRQRASGNAVLDPDVMPLPHRAHSLNPMRRAPGFGVRVGVALRLSLLGILLAASMKGWVASRACAYARGRANATRRWAVGEGSFVRGRLAGVSRVG
jgi:hypothetical protein